MLSLPKFLIPVAVGTSLLGACNPIGDSPTAPPASEPTNPEPSDTPGQPFDTFTEPNVQFAVEADSGNCPATVELWELGLAFEGGADHTVVADFDAIATAPTEILTSETRRIVYEAPLQAEFATCSGTAKSEYLRMYSFNFEEGSVQFEVDLESDEGLREIRYADLSVNRPYIYWRATE